MNLLPFKQTLRLVRAAPGDGKVMSMFAPFCNRLTACRLFTCSSAVSESKGNQAQESKERQAVDVKLLAAKLEEHARALSMSFDHLLKSLETVLADASQSSISHLLVYSEAMGAVKVSHV